MPIRAKDPKLQMSDAARDGFTTLFLTGIVALFAIRYFIVARKKSHPKKP
jgi:hypothetical protein